MKTVTEYAVEWRICGRWDRIDSHKTLITAQKAAINDRKLHGIFLTRIIKLTTREQVVKTNYGARK